MSTSPSWFDQEKFSRLVKKVGPKNVPESAPGHPGADHAARASQPASLEALRAQRSPEEVSQASTAHISLVSKPPSLLSEHRALPTLPRRTSPLPGLKSLFATPDTTLRPPSIQPLPTPPTEEPAAADPAVEEGGSVQEAVPQEYEEGELAAVWEKMALLNEELAQAIQDRDKANQDVDVLREQLRMADEAHDNQANANASADTASSEELSRITKERDDALAEIKDLREQLSNPPAPAPSQESSEQAKEIGLLTEERDQARKQYATLRNQFETLKQEQAPPREDSAKFRKEMEQQLEGFRSKLEERNKEIALLKANPGAATGGGEGGSDEVTAKLRQELLSLREQVQKLKDEASVAQRGLALSQKALQETRDTLREATEGTSLSRHNFDSIKAECATLAQQNTVLTAQNEQLQRDLSAVKSKLTTRL